MRACWEKNRRTVFERYFANALSLIPLCSATDNDKNQLKQQQESPFDSPLEVKLPSHKTLPSSHNLFIFMNHSVRFFFFFLFFRGVQYNDVFRPFFPRL